MNCYMYILECSDHTLYVGSTKDLKRRLEQHQMGEGANHTKKRLPVELVYYEVYDRIDYAFYREKQVQGWSRKKKLALINRKFELLPGLSERKFPNRGLREPQPPIRESQLSGEPQNKMKITNGNRGSCLKLLF